MNIFQQASDNYVTYASYVNASRSLPGILDGFKPIQRRLLICGYRDAGCAASFVKSARVCGTTIARYHPHGESAAYGALVNIVRAPQAAFEGHGNFGARGIAAAAMRYTEVRVSNTAKQLWLKLLGEVPTFENDLGVQEPMFLPTVIPYALVAGAFGIGVGCMTMIPQFDLQSLFDYVLWLHSPKGAAPDVKLNYGQATVAPPVMKSGGGYVIYYPKLRWEQDEDGKQVLVVYEAPPAVDPAKRLMSHLSSEIEQDAVFIRDESTAKTRVVIGRATRTRRITDAQLEQLVKDRLTKKYRVNMVWSTRRGPRREGIVPVLTRALKNFEKLHASDTAKKLIEIQRELRLYQIATKFVSTTMKHNKTDTCKKLNIDSTDYDVWSRKSIASLKDYGGNVGIQDAKSREAQLQGYDLGKRLTETRNSL